MVVGSETIDLIRKELEKEGFIGLTDREIVEHLKAAINNDFIGDMVGMTIYGLLETKLSSKASEIAKIVDE